MRHPLRLLRRSIFLFVLLLTAQGLTIKFSPKYKGAPAISSIGRLYRVQVGEVLTLPCDVHNLGPMVLMWKKGQRVLTAGSMIVKRDKRITLHKHHLVLTNLNIHDGGEYSCEIETDEPQPLAMTHTVEILVPPSIMSQPRNGRIVVRKGTSITIECRANGNPTPTVTWTRKGLPFNRPGAETSNNGMTLTLNNVGRNDSGAYKCRASNGVGNPSIQVIHLQVLYEPEVRVPHRIIHGGINRTAVLTCRVHAEPDPDVKWYKNSHQIDPLGHSKALFNGKKEYSLHISNVGIEDFSTYTCSAVNSLGKDKKVLRLTGSPKRPEIDKIHRLHDGLWKISWNTFSYAPLLQFRIMYRNLPSSQMDVEPAFKWKNVLLKEHLQTFSPHSDPSFRNSFYHLNDLFPQSFYEVQVQAKNSFGWSDKSHIRKFYTTTPEEESNEDDSKEHEGIQKIKDSPQNSQGSSPIDDDLLDNTQKKESWHSGKYNLSSIQASDGDEKSPQIIRPERKHSPHYKSSLASHQQSGSLLKSFSLIFFFFLSNVSWRIFFQV
ncbi:protein amalgam [Lepeophtheirus salmonis]|uniref:protein amalgam n=1 Tax=Lepeophtheirus salmonis TaxID=72036 RepID=UPI001AE67447|nr:immunoglobulin superfamily DCC subclass member 3-like [Lepeophtheirus salmonis]